MVQWAFLCCWGHVALVRWLLDEMVPGAGVGILVTSFRLVTDAKGFCRHRGGKEAERQEGYC